jgi:hypothetical protein
VLDSLQTMEIIAVMEEDPEGMDMEGPTDPMVMHRADRQKIGAHREKGIAQEEEEEGTPQTLLTMGMTMKTKMVSTGIEIIPDSRIGT